MWRAWAPCEWIGVMSESGTGVGTEVFLALDEMGGSL